MARHRLRSIEERASRDCSTAFIVIINNFFASAPRSGKRKLCGANGKRKQQRKHRHVEQD
jgi:hypothetical protein